MSLSVHFVDFKAATELFIDVLSLRIFVSFYIYLF